MTDVLIPEETETPKALCNLCEEPMVFIGRSKYGTPLFFCDNMREGQRMPDDGQAWPNLLKQRIRESSDY